jgi:hypothetical protein
MEECAGICELDIILHAIVITFASYWIDIRINMTPLRDRVSTSEQVNRID